jgi:hypothetical protein
MAKGSSSFQKTTASAQEVVNKLTTVQGAETGPSPNQADGRQFQPGSTSAPAPAPKPRSPTLAAGMYPTMQGATIPVSPNDARQGWPSTQLAQPEGYTGGGGAGDAGGKMEVAGGYGTTQGAVVPFSPNQAATVPAWTDDSGSVPVESGTSGNGRSTVEAGPLQNGATRPPFNTGQLARKGMSKGNEMPAMARGTPAMARIASGDLRRGMAPVDADVARPVGQRGSNTLAGFARGKGGYVPLDPQGIMGVRQAPTMGPGQAASPAIPRPESGAGV